MSTQESSANSSLPNEEKAAEITPEQKRSIAAATLSELMKQAEELKIESEE